MSVNLMQFLPEYYRNITEMIQLTNTENEELDCLYSVIAQVLLNLAIKSADEKGIIYYEYIYGIQADPENETLEFRRERLLSRSSLLPLYTMPWLRLKLDEIIGQNKWTVTIENDYDLHIVGNADQNWLDELMILLTKVKPCNMNMIVDSESKVSSLTPVIGMVTIDGDIITISPRVELLLNRISKTSLIALDTRQLIRNEYSGNFFKIRRTADGVIATFQKDENKKMSMNSVLITASGVTNATVLGEFVANTSFNDTDSLGAACDGYAEEVISQGTGSLAFTQTTPTNQPKIITSGEFETAEGEVALKFDTISESYLSHSNALITGSFSICVDFNLISNDGWVRIWDWDNLETFHMLTNSGADTYNLITGQAGVMMFDGIEFISLALGSLSLNTDYNLIITFDATSKTLTAYLNNVLIGSDQNLNFDVSEWLARFDQWLLGRSAYAFEDPYLDGYIKRFIVFDGILSSNDRSILNE